MNKEDKKYIDDLTLGDVTKAVFNSVGKTFMDSINYIGDHPVISTLVLVPSIFVYTCLVVAIHDAK